jgi:opacity protein-like surface antigen
MKKLSLALAAALSLLAVSAEAQQRTWPNWYVGIHARMAWVEDTDVTLGNTNIGDASFDNGYGGGASLGYMPGGDGFFNHTRFELEYSFNQADIDTIAGVSAGKDLRVHSYMVNAFYDIPTGTSIVPYIGAGAGLARVDLDVPGIGLNENDSVFAYQFMGGLGYTPSTVPNTTLTVGYRYFASDDPSFGLGATTVEHELSSHNVEVGARFAF